MSAAPHILILTYGTRGDVEPFLALALGLRDRGFRVTIATAARFTGWIESLGLSALPLSDRSLDQLDTEDGRLLVEGGGGLIRRIAAGVRLSRTSSSINAELIEETWQAFQKVKPDLILYHPKIMAAAHIAEASNTPVMMAQLQPMTVPTREFPPAGFPALKIPGWNRFAYELIYSSYGMFKKPVNAFRFNQLGLNKLRRGRDILFPPGAGRIPVLHAISPTVLARPGDWPEHAHITGYWRLRESGSFSPPVELDRFLQEGEPPVYVGFGSMTSTDTAGLAQLVADALRQAGVRGVVGSGWAGLDLPASDDLITIPAIPHEWLFPRMAAVVHHGGAGTTAAGFYAGVPSVICPFVGDQPGWAAKSVALGVGASAIPRRLLTSDRLAKSITQAVTDKRLIANAKVLAARLRAEDGIGNAIKLIEAFLRNT